MEKKLIELDNDLLIHAINQADVGVTISNPRLPDNPLIYVNQKFLKQTGYTKEECIGKNCRFLQGPNTDENTVRELRHAIKENRKLNVEILNYKKNGEEFWNDLTITPIFDYNGELSYFTGVQKDITPRKKTEEVLKLYEKVIENTLQGVIITDQNGCIITVNKAFTITTGYSVSEVKGKNPNILSSGIHQPQFYQQLWNELLEEGQWKGEIWNKRKNGNIYPQFLNISAVRDELGKISNFVAVFSDITENKIAEKKLKEVNKKLKQLSLIDSLTSISNRRHFDEFLIREWHQAQRFSLPISLLIIDIDNFKNYNDLYGHQKGDKCIQYVSNEIHHTIKRKTDLVARYGGEEFAVILPNTELDSAKHVAEVIRKNIMKLSIPHLDSEIEKIVTISIGVASMVPSSYCKQHELIQKADIALYKAKKNGRNKVEIWEG